MEPRFDERVLPFMLGTVFGGCLFTLAVAMFAPTREQTRGAQLGTPPLPIARPSREPIEYNPQLLRDQQLTPVDK